MAMSWKQKMHMWLLLKLKPEMVLEDPPFRVLDTEGEMMAEEIWEYVCPEASPQPLNAAHSDNDQCHR